MITIRNAAAAILLGICGITLAPWAIAALIAWGSQ